MMQYDDDIEESKVSESKQLVQPSLPSSKPDKAASVAKEEEKKQPKAGKKETLDDITAGAAGSDEDEDDDFLMDDPMAFIERHDSCQQADVANLFEDDPKAKRR